ncbi:lipase family protein [Gordonia liuliyuniae]|uniref:Lipase family protein n=1 Tax=Gordonia liuliyuniae TaxID=2911517 RepID=A0ABS9INL9_9ACTN|nr:lipase family protein [Gordonia liuliyuniae]MCF8587125.1 lipase family protein [Gordonia liuliyuniae]
MRRPFVLTLVAAVTAVLTAGAVAAPVTAAPQSATPKIAPAPLLPLPQELDASFYRPSPKRLAAAENGEIIAARRITPANFGAVPINVDAWQLSFRSTNTSGEAIPAVTTVLKPRGAVKKGPRKVISMQLAEDSTAGYCATSYAVQHLNASSLLGQAVAPAELLIAQGFLHQGYAVVLPDHEGPEHAYAAGPLGARITLDSLRAARSFAPSSISDASPIGLYGYSGGAIVTGHTAEIKQSYAPELNIVGAAEGGVPADLKVVLNAAQNNVTSGLVLGAIAGLAREYDYFDKFLDTRLNPAGKALLAAKGPLCVQYQALTFPFLNNKGFINWPGDPLAAPPVKRVLTETKMGSVRPDMPMYIWNSALDEVIPVGQVDTMVRSYCRTAGPSITYTRDHLSEHLIGEVSGAPMALLWLKDRLDGKPAASGCTTHDELSMATDATWWPTFSQTIGADLSALFGAALGKGK